LLNSIEGRNLRKEKILADQIDPKRKPEESESKETNDNWVVISISLCLYSSGNGCCLENRENPHSS
jgi:hypothetical protein